MPKVWLITGASTGFGRALGEELLRRGESVVATARRIDGLVGFDHRHVLDVTDAAQVAEVTAEVIRDHGRIDVLVNNAGHGLLGAVEEVGDEQLRALLEVNLLGAWRMTRAVLPAMREQRSGHVVQISSVGGVVANPGHAAYASSKFALEGMSEALAGEVADWGIGVTIVEPGPFRTDFAGRSIETSTPIPAYAQTPAGQLRQRFGDQDGRQPNDPIIAARMIIEAVGTDHPPLRLPLGPEAVGRIREKLTGQLAELDRWAERASATRFHSPSAG